MVDEEVAMTGIGEAVNSVSWGRVTGGDVLCLRLGEGGRSTVPYIRTLVWFPSLDGSTVDGGEMRVEVKK